MQVTHTSISYIECIFMNDQMNLLLYFRPENRKFKMECHSKMSLLLYFRPENQISQKHTDQ